MVRGFGIIVDLSQRGFLIYFRAYVLGLYENDDDRGGILGSG